MDARARDAVKDQPSQYLAEIDQIEIVDPRTIDVIMKHPEQPMLTVLCGPTNGILERKVVEAHGGTNAANANTEDKATNWLNQNSAGAGPYTLVGWTRNAQILLTRNPHYWRGPAPFERVVIRHMGDSATQLLAVKRGDIDAAFNLIPEQVATLKGDPNIRVEGLESLDFVYMAVTSEAEFNKALAVKEARQAIGWAIDYDGIINSLLGGTALRCASFIPIGLYGSNQGDDRTDRLPSGSGKGESAADESGIPRWVRIQTELRRRGGVGPVLRRAGAEIAIRPGAGWDQGSARPDGQVNLRTQYTGGKSTAVLTFWNPSGVEIDGWASATVQRVAKRVHMTPSPELVKLTQDAAAETDPAKKSAMYVGIPEGHHRPGQSDDPVPADLSVRRARTIKSFPLTAAGWEVELSVSF